MSRVVLLGATGFTGTLTARRLLDHGIAPLLAGRSADRLARLADDLGLSADDTARIDLDDPASIGDLLSEGDVLITTVGPFLRVGHVALEAAIAAGAHYVDSTGEAPFVREVFGDPSSRAAARGALLLPALGYDFVPGNLAGALALERAGSAATRVDVGYFFLGDPRTPLSGGTKASAGGVLTRPGFTYRDGRVVDERCGARVRRFDVQGERAPALTLGSSEVLTLPRSFPWLRDVDVYQGGLGAATPIAAQFGRIAAAPRLADAVARLIGRLVPGSTGGPDEAERRRSGTHVVARAFDDGGRLRSEVVLQGPNVYDVTAGALAWGAAELAAGRGRGAGAAGPVEAFGIDALVRGCAQAGVVEVGGGSATAGSAHAAGPVAASPAPGGDVRQASARSTSSSVDGTAALAGADR
ncbi:MAG: saccharopine dehydrogenase NADP-binding domain-containing protein [Solirubrobacteraceae bacterium]|nr:saccharopine dehydrogenase NADP-binding domain-containing protein [Solirubrobacteraceae bacterium]